MDIPDDNRANKIISNNEKQNKFPEKLLNIKLS